jgi:hypothetical protein
VCQQDRRTQDSRGRRFTGSGGEYRGTSLIKTVPPQDSTEYTQGPMLVLRGVGLFLMSEVPLYRGFHAWHWSTVSSRAAAKPADQLCVLLYASPSRLERCDKTLESTVAAQRAQPLYRNVQRF